VNFLQGQIKYEVSSPNTHWQDHFFGSLWTDGGSTGPQADLVLSLWVVKLNQEDHQGYTPSYTPAIPYLVVESVRATLWCQKRSLTDLAKSRDVEGLLSKLGMGVPLQKYTIRLMVLSEGKISPVQLAKAASEYWTCKSAICETNNSEQSVTQSTIILLRIVKPVTGTTVCLQLMNPAPPV
jgi:hypothetical protein